MQWDLQSKHLTHFSRFFYNNNKNITFKNTHNELDGAKLHFKRNLKIYIMELDGAKLHFQRNEKKRVKMKFDTICFNNLFL